MARPTRQPATAVVTGGSSGIGRAFVAELHRTGWQVVTCGRDASKLAALEKAYPGIRTHVCDVSDKASVMAFADAVLAAHPEVRLLVNNAGGLREIDFNRPDLLAQDLTQELRANLEGAIHMTASFLPALRAAAPANIIMMSSGYGLAPATRAPLYSASKAGLRSFTKALRRQLAGQGITITDVAPPAVDTPATAHYQADKLTPEHVVKVALNAAKAGRSEVYPGKARWLPLLLRLAPQVAERLVSKT